MVDSRDIIARLEVIVEELGDLALDRLRESVTSGDVGAVAEERRYTRARRAVEKAAGVLAGMPDASTQEDDQ